ncbi:MAG TPA: preprotein translocase subunit SecG [Patescibacteria group bacterium]|nr:preprotein translocase subunit SecG [Patescibacteria group bacterium]
MIAIIQIIICVALITVIMLQSRGDASAAGLAGQAQNYRSKKGLEKVLFYATIVLAILFASVSIISIIL